MRETQPERLRIYVAGPYTCDPEGGTARAIEAAHALLDLGFAPYVPHLTHYLEQVRSRPYPEWLALDLQFLRLCHAVLRLPGESAGADWEVGQAQGRGLPVFSDLESLHAWSQCR